MVLSVFRCKCAASVRHQVRTSTAFNKVTGKNIAKTFIVCDAWQFRGQYNDLTIQWSDNSMTWQLNDLTTHGLAIQWSDNSMVWQFNDLLTQRSAGLTVCWPNGLSTNGLLIQWYVDSMVCRLNGLPSQWYVNSMVSWLNSLPSQWYVNSMVMSTQRSVDLKVCQLKCLSTQNVCHLKGSFIHSFKNLWGNIIYAIYMQYMQIYMQ